MKKRLLSLQILSFAVLSFFFFITFTLSSAQASNNVQPDQAQLLEKEGSRLIIKWRKWTPDWVKDRILQKQALIAEAHLKLDNTLSVYKAKLSNESLALSQLTNHLNSHLWIEYAESDYIATTLSVPNDSYHHQQWALDIIQVYPAWDTIDGSSNIDIAIVDTGIQKNHPDLQTKISGRINFTWNSDDDGHGHGTHVAGIAAAITNNQIGIAGTCPQCRLMSIKVLDNQGRGYYSWIAEGIIWAVDNGAEIINLSLGGVYSSTTLENAIEYAWSRGVVVVAAAGNYGTNNPTYPAYYPTVISVAATNSSDQKPSWSNYGSWVDLAAPGDSIFSTYINNQYQSSSGTSMAAPHTAGILALIKSRYPTWSVQQLREKLQSSSDHISGTGTYWQYGRINACKAVDCSINLTTPTPSSQPTITPTPITLPSITSTPTATSTPTPSPTSVLINTPTPEPTNTSTPQPTQTPAPTLTPTTPPSPTPPSPTPTPTSSDLPWWCKYVPHHWSCQ